MLLNGLFAILRLIINISAVIYATRIMLVVAQSTGEEDTTFCHFEKIHEYLSRDICKTYNASCGTTYGHREGCYSAILRVFIDTSAVIYARRIMLVVAQPTGILGDAIHANANVIGN